MSFAIWGNPDFWDALRGATSGLKGSPPPVIPVLTSPFLINLQAAGKPYLLSIKDVIPTTPQPAGGSFLLVRCAWYPEPIHREDYPRLVHPTVRPSDSCIFVPSLDPLN